MNLDRRSILGSLGCLLAAPVFVKADSLMKLRGYNMDPLVVAYKEHDRDYNNHQPLDTFHNVLSSHNYHYTGFKPKSVIPIDNEIIPGGGFYSPSPNPKYFITRLSECIPSKYDNLNLFASNLKFENGYYSYHEIVNFNKKVSLMNNALTPSKCGGMVFDKWV